MTPDKFMIALTAVTIVGLVGYAAWFLLGKFPDTKKDEEYPWIFIDLPEKEKKVEKPKPVRKPRSVSKKETIKKYNNTPKKKPKLKSKKKG
jgi:hypothetical protein